MAGAMRHDVVARAALTEDELRQVHALAAICNAHDGLDLKLNRGSVRDSARPEARTYLAYNGGALVGCATLDGFHDIEICGIVHPAARRGGLGRALLAAAVEECRRRATGEALVLCEEASAPGTA